MSIQALKESLPQLTDAKFEQVYRQFFLKALGPVLGFERAPKSAGEDWDQVLDVFAAERERRERAKELIPKMRLRPGNGMLFVSASKNPLADPFPRQRRA